jgi:DNA adenine methylase
MYAVSPMRYPGAKWRLDNFLTALLVDNGLRDGHYAEPYAGGASLALSLLYNDKVSDIHLNDLDRSIYAFWKAATEYGDELIDRIEATKVDMDTWHQQKAVQQNKRHASIMDLGFATFFLNRTNRSGILTAGVIGGKQQTGAWKIDSRFTKNNLIDRIKKIQQYKSRIHVTKFDAITFLSRRGQELPKKCLFYLDPPYFVKGQELYMNAYKPNDHADVATQVLNKLDRPWIVSYDDVPEIRNLYKSSHRKSYVLRYSASTERNGREVVFISPGLKTKPSLLAEA